MSARPIRRIGILGGMGPRATVAFYDEVVSLCTELYGAKRDEDFPSMVLESISIPGFDATGIEDKDVALGMLTAGAKRLEASGADFIAMPCNTAHAHHDELQSAVSIPLLHIAKAVSREVSAKGFGSVCLLATDQTVASGMYHDIRAFAPSATAQRGVREMITAIEDGTFEERHGELFRSLDHEAASAGADALLLGCTELSRKLFPGSTLPLLDSSHLLARAAVRAAYGEPFDS